MLMKSNWFHSQFRVKKSIIIDYYLGCYKIHISMESFLHSNANLSFVWRMKRFCDDYGSSVDVKIDVFASMLIIF